MRVGNVLKWEQVTGEPLMIDDAQLTPQTRVLRVQAPFGGFVWNHPVAVIVERAGKRERMQVPDVTLFLQLAMLVSLVALPISLWARWKGVNR